MMTRIIIQDRSTGMYLKNLGRWTQKEAEAFSFSCTSSALLYCVRNQLAQTQIVMKFGPERYDIQLPVFDQSRWNQGCNLQRLMQ